MGRMADQPIDRILPQNGTMDEPHHFFSARQLRGRGITAISFLFLLWSCAPTETTAPTGPASPDGPPNILLLFADDWSYPHASAYGDAVVHTPTFDRLAAEGALFDNAYCAAPSCAPSRAALLTGRYPHALGSAGNLWSVFPDSLTTYVDVLAGAGYHVGKTRKGWGPGETETPGDNPAGPQYADFETFLDARAPDQPFCFWFGSQDPHRRYERGTGRRTGMDPAAVQVPAFLPDNDCVRNDLLDYYYEVERFDRESGNLLRALERRGLLDNTLVVMTSDNGMPFPRAKANLYDAGTRMPLAMRYPPRIPAGERYAAFTNSVDLAPTFLEAAGVPVPPSVQGRSLWPLLERQDATGRQAVYLERERHANARAGDLSYPMRAVRTADHLYIRNFFPERHPAGDPTVHRSVGQYGDIDNSIAKFYLMRDSTSRLASLSLGKRPAEELYVLADDPDQLDNRIAAAELADTRQSLRTQLDEWMAATADPRAENPRSLFWDTSRYTPDYQHADFDLKKRLANYRYTTRRGGDGWAELPCE